MLKTLIHPTNKLWLRIAVFLLIWINLRVLG
jgi:hypothetical protein